MKRAVSGDVLASAHCHTELSLVLRMVAFAGSSVILAGEKAPAQSGQGLSQIAPEILDVLDTHAQSQ